MRHKYDTRGIVLGRSHIGEANSSIAVLTEDLGIIRARAQGVRKPGAKLAASLTTYTESVFMLVRGKEGWRIVGAVREEDWFARLSSVKTARARAARVVQLLLRLVAGESQDTELFPIVCGFFEALATMPEDEHEAIEILAVLRILAVLGLDSGAMPGGGDAFTAESLSDIVADRTAYITRINNGIAASGL